MKKALIIITSLVGLTSIVCGAMLVGNPDGSWLQLTPSLLKYNVFKDFLIPGFVLLILVGGSNSLAAVALLLQQKRAGLFSLFGGLMINGWIVVQVILTGVLFWLQFVYLGAGISIWMLSLQLREKKLI